MKKKKIYVKCDWNLHSDFSFTQSTIYAGIVQAQANTEGLF